MASNELSLWPSAEDPLFAVEERKTGALHEYDVFGYDLKRFTPFKYEDFTQPLVQSFLWYGRQLGALWLSCDYPDGDIEGGSPDWLQFPRIYFQQRMQKQPGGKPLPFPIFVLDNYHYAEELEAHLYKVQERLTFETEDVPNWIWDGVFAMFAGPRTSLEEGYATLVRNAHRAAGEDGKLDDLKWAEIVSESFKLELRSLHDAGGVRARTKSPNLLPFLLKGARQGAVRIRNDPWYKANRQSLRWNWEEFRLVHIDGLGAGIIPESEQHEEGLV